MADKRTGDPAFKVILGTGHEYKIWSDGYTEGFPRNCMVVNRIPLVIAEHIQGALEDERSAHDLPGEDN